MITFTLDSKSGVPIYRQIQDQVRYGIASGRLSPGERVAFVLHDVFGVPFDSISETVGRPVGTCRQLARRARAKFVAAQPKTNAVASTEHQLVTEKFITACANGDLTGLAAVLDPTVWGVGSVCLVAARRPHRASAGSYHIAHRSSSSAS